MIKILTMFELQGTAQTAEKPCDFSVKVAELRKARKRQAAQFSKRRMTILKKAHELYRDCGTDIYLCLRSRRNNQMWLYSNGFIPPLASEVVSYIERGPLNSCKLLIHFR